MNSASAITAGLWRALAVFRVVVLIEAIAVNVAQWDQIARPAAAAIVLAAMSAWTVAAPALYAKATGNEADPGFAGVSSPRAWQPAWTVLAADLGLAVLTLLVTPWIQGPELVDQHAFTLGSYWVAASMFAAALLFGWRGGLAAALLLSVVDVALRSGVRPSTVSNVFLLLVAGGLVGYLVQTVQTAARIREQAVQLTSAAHERERLARAVHDGVLQVLALIQRRGAEIGGETAELGRLAGEQEVALRALVRTAAVPASTVEAGLVDLNRLLEPMASTTVEVSTPGAPVVMVDDVAIELAAAVTEALENVRRHCPPDTRSYVFVEDLSHEVVVSVRDEGPGIDPGRLVEAADEGRLGVKSSIQGRLELINGRAQMTSDGHGTEWELHVPVSWSR